MGSFGRYGPSPVTENEEAGNDELETRTAPTWRNGGLGRSASIRRRHAARQVAVVERQSVVTGWPTLPGIWNGPFTLSPREQCARREAAGRRMAVVGGGDSRWRGG